MTYTFELTSALLCMILFAALIGLVTRRKHSQLITQKYDEIVSIEAETKKKLNDVRQKYSAIIDIETEIEKLECEKSEVHTKIETLREAYKEKRLIFTSLVEEAAIYNEEIELAGLGFYKSHFEFDTSEQHKENVNKIKLIQKSLLKSKEAVVCSNSWAVDGSKRKGTTMTNRGIRLTARAFNNECETAISNARWNNIDRMELRINKAFTAINKLNTSNGINITPHYLEARISELRAVYEYKNHRQKEKEEQRENRRQMREEARFVQEMDVAIKEEDKYTKLLNKAKLDAEKSAGLKLDALNQKILDLKLELKIAHDKTERAKSMAQQTKSGHVYVISNIGSFGENIYKIGMTRRLEPLDRVKELGDASVPFTFDVHALIYSEDAPSLENELHKSFALNKINLVNNRKEFFNVELNDIEKVVKKISPDAEFIKTQEARDYRETQSIIAQRSAVQHKSTILERYPDEL